jgi:hypothetical protein
MKRAPRSRQRHDLYAKYHDYDSEISDLLGECGFMLALRYLQNRISLFLTLPIASIEEMAMRQKLAEIGRAEGASPLSGATE